MSQPLGSSSQSTADIYKELMADSNDADAQAAVYEANSKLLTQAQQLRSAETQRALNSSEAATTLSEGPSTVLKKKADSLLQSL